LFQRDDPLVGPAERNEDAVFIRFEDGSVDPLAILQRFFAERHPGAAREEGFEIDRRGEFPFQLGLQITREWLADVGDGRFGGAWGLLFGAAFLVSAPPWLPFLRASVGMRWRRKLVGTGRIGERCGVRSRFVANRRPLGGHGRSRPSPSPATGLIPRRFSALRAIPLSGRDGLDRRLG
jgi:hypothetical protein